METILAFSTEIDVASAVEAVYEYEAPELLNSNIFGLNNALSFINFACIKETDSVITIGSHLDVATELISYIYTPKELLTIRAQKSHCTDDTSRRSINELLIDYKYTEPIFCNLEIEFSDNSFDVAFIGFSDTINSLSQQCINRFNLETGVEYEIFEKYLIKSSKLLREEGRLVVLTKPGWILKCWSLIEELGLQLEYDNYSLYSDCMRHSNSFLWLRFIKRIGNIDLDIHKKNILSLMEDNSIDRLYAHRNNLRFPYVELSYNNSEAYVKLDQNLEYMQYFFSYKTTATLAELCEGYTACLVTPSIAQYAYKLKKNIVLFDRDNRFRENGGLKYVKYDLNIGLSKFAKNRYLKKFDRVICDPPFDIKLEVLAKDIVELLAESKKSITYIVFPSSRKVSLINAMKTKGLQLVEVAEKITIEYAKPPKLVRVNGREAIQLYKFMYLDNSA
jgi:hypothetical protein